MVLTLEDIKKVTVGALDIYKEDGVICFDRCTKKQLNVYSLLSPNQRIACRATAGVRLNFYTNSSYFAFTVGKSARYELKINGVCVNEESKQGERKEFTLTEKESKITLYLSSHIRGSLISVEVEDGAYMKPCVYDLKLLCLGDSVTQGWNSEIDYMSYAYAISENLNANSIIQGVGGSKFNPQTLDKLDFEPDVITIAYGINDANQARSIEDISSISQNCNDYLMKVKEYYPTSKIFVITPVNRIHNDEILSYGCVRMLDDIIKSNADSLGLEVIDGLKMFPHGEEYMFDNVHPNNRGFIEYGKNLTAELKTRLFKNL